MPVSLSDLFLEEQFHLRLLVEPPGIEVLQAPIGWAHSSDLPDPTPWLEPGQLLLTDGAHFLEHTDLAFARAYVDRLVARQVIALGFATDVIHDAVPQALVQASREAGLPLVEVAQRTPFMALIRHVADRREAEQRQRLEALLEAHRAIGRAALRPNGLEAILGELEHRLDSWVALFDSSGHLYKASTRRAMPGWLTETVVQEVRTALHKGLRTSIRQDSPTGYTVQTIGRRGSLRAALAVGLTAPLDRSGVELVNSVIAMASIALEQSSALGGARDALRRALLELLLAGELAVARRTALQLDIAVPGEGPVCAMIAVGPGTPDELGVLLARFDCFVAHRDGQFLMLIAAGLAGDAAQVVAESGCAVVVSSPVAWPDASTAVRQAELLDVREQPAGSVRTFESLSGSGLMGVLRRGDGALVAGALLRPVLEAEDGQRLLDNARTWFQYNGAYDPAARDLGVHRHTLRSRMEALGRLTGLNLDRFADRAELFSAMALLPMD